MAHVLLDPFRMYSVKIQPSIRLTEGPWGMLGPSFSKDRDTRSSHGNYFNVE